VEKIINIATILVVAALGITGFMVMNYTAESNKVTADIAKIQSEHKTRVIQEIGLLTVEVRNLEKDVDKILEVIKKIERDKKNGKKTQKPR
jgi:metal-responsive CopG/Arc/MetJ family transcriptional regulator